MVLRAITIDKQKDTALYIRNSSGIPRRLYKEIRKLDTKIVTY